jgi:hypothetical protein
MLHSEIYGTYFRTVAAILTRSLAGDLNGKTLSEIVRRTAFGESLLTIPASLTDGRWPLLRPDLTTPLKRAPGMPLSALEKRWLKSLLLDPRIALFDPPTEGLEDVEPLFDPEVFVFYDRCADGDPYGDPRYIRVFRMLLCAMEERRRVRVRFQSARGRRRSDVCIPYTLEYSAKDDKFRLLASSGRQTLTVNVARIASAVLLDAYSAEEYRPVNYRETSLTMLLTDERNALERALLHFSDLEKETEQLDGKHYKITIWYRQVDETEILIRILSFGPVLKVTEPAGLVAQLRARIARQTAL